MRFSKNFIIWTLACIALFMIAIPIIPHHHHDDMYTICLNAKDDALKDLRLNCNCNSSCNHEPLSTSLPDTKTCSDGCITNIHAIKYNLTDHIQFEQQIFQLFNIQISDFLISFLSPIKRLDEVKSVYINTLYREPLVDFSSLRAPPYFNA